MYHQKSFWFDVLVNYFGDKCNYCGSETRLHLHHILPISRGGKNVLSNLELVCILCHVKLHKQIDKLFPLKIKNYILNCIICGQQTTRKIKLKNPKCKMCKNKAIRGFYRKKKGDILTGYKRSLKTGKLR